MKLPQKRGMMFLGCNTDTGWVRSFCLFPVGVCSGRAEWKIGIFWKFVVVSNFLGFELEGQKGNC
jgi:hypothetical protein